MGKVVNNFPSNQENNSSPVREKQQGCIKKKRRKKQLDQLRQQVVESKHAMRKNLTTQVKGRKTSCTKSLRTTDFPDETGRRQEAINKDNTQYTGKVGKQDQKKAGPKLLANTFIGLFKNGAKGNEVHREEQFFNATDIARFNGNVFKLLRGNDSSVSEKLTTSDKTLPTKIQVDIKNLKSSARKILKKSPILVKAIKDKRKRSLINTLQAIEKSDRQPELKGLSSRKHFNTHSTENIELEQSLEVGQIKRKFFLKNQKESGSESRTAEDEFQRCPNLMEGPQTDIKSYNERKKGDKINKESGQSMNYYSLKASEKLEQHFSSSISPIEICKQFCDTVSLTIFGNCLAVFEKDPLQRTRLSLQRLFSDSHRQHLLRGKIDFTKSEKIQAFEFEPNYEANLDSIETKGSDSSFEYSENIQGFDNHFKENQQQCKGPTEKSILLSRFNSAVDLNLATIKTDSSSSNTTATIAETRQHTKLFKNFFSRYINNADITSKVNNNACGGQELKDIKGENVFKDAFCADDVIPMTKNSPINSSYTESNTLSTAGVDQKSPVVSSILQISFEKDTVISEDNNNNIYYYSSKQLKPPKIKKKLRDKESDLLKSKLNFMESKNKQIQSKIDGESRADEKKKNLLRFEQLFAYELPNDLSHKDQSLHVDKNEIYVNQKCGSSARRDISTFGVEEQQQQQLLLMKSMLEPKKNSENFKEYFNQELMYKNNVDIERDKKMKYVKLYNNPATQRHQRPVNRLPSSSSSLFPPMKDEGLTNSHQNLMMQSHVFRPHQHLQPEKIAFVSKPQKVAAADLNILNQVENLHLFTNTAVALDNQDDPSHHGKKDIFRASLCNLQTHHCDQQPSKFIAVEDDHVQRKVPIYFHNERNKPAYITTHFPSSHSNPPNKNITTSKLILCPLECDEQINTQVIRNKAHTVSCIKCANTTSDSIVFYNQNISNMQSPLQQVILKSSLKTGTQDVQYYMDKICNPNVPEVRFIQSNKNNTKLQDRVKGSKFDESIGRKCGHGGQQQNHVMNERRKILKIARTYNDRSRCVKLSKEPAQVGMLVLDNYPTQYIKNSGILEMHPQIRQKCKQVRIIN